MSEMLTESERLHENRITRRSHSRVSVIYHTSLPTHEVIDALTCVMPDQSQRFHVNAMPQRITVTEMRVTTWNLYPKPTE
jgi:hypothetical protein